jgi:transposase
MPLTPTQVQYLADLQARLDAARQGQKGALIADAAASLGVSVQTVQRWLKDHMGRTTGRKRRSDAGQRAIDHAELLTISAALLGTFRKTGNRIMTFDQAVEMLKADGQISTDLSASRIAVILREKGLHPDQLTRPTPAIEQRSLHPNHVGQVDASVCVAYYLSNAVGLQVMDEKKFYKNKPSNVTRIQAERLIRYTYADHCTHEILCRYYLGSECAAHLTDFLIWCFAPKDGHIVHGVPFIVQMDMGSANTSASARNLLTRLQVEQTVHERHNSRANGSVEKAHHLVEIHFESSLNFVHVRDLDDLNQKALAWSNWYGATKVHSRYQRTRHEAWMMITAEQLRIAPPVDVMRELVTSHPVDRRVSNNLDITYAVKGHGSQTFDLRFVPGVMPGAKVQVVVNPYRLPAIDVAYTDDSTGEICWMTVEPIERDDWGKRTDAPVIGQEIRTAPRSRVDDNRDAATIAAYGGADLDEAKARQEKGALVFEGRVNPFTRFEEAQLPAFLPRRGTAHDITTRQVEAARLSWVESAKRLKDLLGSDYTPEVFKWLQQRWPEQSVPEDKIAGIAAQFRSPAAAPAEAPSATGTTGLRIVGGGS